MKRVTFNVDGWIITIPIREEDLEQIKLDWKDEIVRIVPETREWVK